MGELEFLAWPGAALVFGVVALVIFNKPITRVIDNIKRVGKDGITIESPSPESQQEQTTTAPETAQNLLDAGSSSPIIAEREQFVRTTLETAGLPITGETVRVLIRQLAATQLLLDFEQTYNAIFGSQIYVLKQLNESQVAGRDLTFMNAHMENIKKHFPAFEPWTLDQYLTFLFGSRLISSEGNQYRITMLGIEFLTWMARNGRSENRAF